MPEVGEVVRALSGREAGRLHVITAVCGDRVGIADGRHRKLCDPKKKNPRHIMSIGVKLRPEEYSTDRRLRISLRTLPVIGTQQQS